MESLAPLVDEKLAREIFAVQDAEDAREFRMMFVECLADATTRLTRLREPGAFPPKEAARELHQLRGVIANFALARAAQRLCGLEYAWDETTTDARTDVLVAAAADIVAGSGILRATYAFLNES